MDGKNDMRFTIRPAFALVAVSTFSICAFLSACADASPPQSFPANLIKVDFTEVKNTPETMKKYPFMEGYFSDPGDIKVSIAEINEGTLKNIVLRMNETKEDCGVECNLDIYNKTKDGFKEIKGLLAKQPVFVQVCPNKTSLVTTESYGAAQWVYNGTEFQEAETYSSLNKVPSCTVK